MSGTHSLDPRERVIAAWRQGKSAIARRFMLGYSTVRRYIVRFEASGSVRARPPGAGALRKVDAAGEAVLWQSWCASAPTRRMKSPRGCMRCVPGVLSITRRSIGAAAHGTDT
jgi:transposase